jgi:hypothetical protein
MGDLAKNMKEAVESAMREAGFTPQTPQKEQKETTGVRATIIFPYHSSRMFLKKDGKK